MSKYVRYFATVDGKRVSESEWLDMAEMSVTDAISMCHFMTEQYGKNWDVEYSENNNAN